MSDFTRKPNDAVLVAWIITTLAWDVLTLGTTTYLVFWKDASGWLFFLAILLCSSTTLYKVLRKRYGIAEDDD
jgi:hypothetical protein